MSVKKKKQSVSKLLSSKTLLVYFLLMVITISATTLFYFIVEQSTTPVLLDKTSLDYAYTVKDGVGINLDSDKLQFGGGPVGSTLSRGVNISLPASGIVHLSWIGNGSIYTDKNDFYLAGNTSEEIMFNLFIPENQPLGNYTGTIEVEIFEAD